MFLSKESLDLLAQRETTKYEVDMKIICQKCKKEMNLKLPDKGNVKVSFLSYKCPICSNLINLKEEIFKYEGEISAARGKRKKQG